MADSSRPSVDLVLKGLDAEIARLRDEDLSPGWTNWAVIAGIGTLLWATAGLSQVHYSRPTAQLIVALSLCLDFLLSLRSIQISDTESAPRYRPARFFRRYRLYGLMFGIRAVLLIIAARWLAGGWFNVEVALVVWAYGPRGAMLLAFVGLMWTGHAIGPRQFSRWVDWVQRLFFGAGADIALAASAVYVGRNAFAEWRMGLLATDDLRFAGAVVAIVFLTSKIASEGSNPVADALVTTRRDLAFGRIDASTAVGQAEVAIAGMRLSEFYQSDIAEFLRLLQTARGEISQVVNKVESLVQSVPSTIDISPVHLALIRSVRDSCGLHLKRVKGAVKQLKKARIYTRTAFAPQDQVQEIKNRLDHELELLDGDVELVVARMNEARTLFEAAEAGGADSAIGAKAATA